MTLWIGTLVSAKFVDRNTSPDSCRIVFAQTRNFQTLELKSTREFSPPYSFVNINSSANPQ